ncbi:hypothetical protein PVAR5_1590 [Paecilomyces variotii No. 5]|uniref:Uncharacterized protein n=1 Tax=Byssochlamys spectabilis (strain No. 5 / NBRC 109023) TaxID=1356009 RepID=V5HTV9_BYSSN|nr:hypothetical protein PVAR5_1590 [Paecilomyces variotii No. 5]
MQAKNAIIKLIAAPSATTPPTFVIKDPTRENGSDARYRVYTRFLDAMPEQSKWLRKAPALWTSATPPIKPAINHLRIHLKKIRTRRLLALDARICCQDDPGDVSKHGIYSGPSQQPFQMRGRLNVLNVSLTFSAVNGRFASSRVLSGHSSRRERPVTTAIASYGSSAGLQIVVNSTLRSTAASECFCFSPQNVSHKR